MVSVPLRSQSNNSPVQGPTTLSMSTVTVTKPQTGSPGSPSNTPASPALLQGVTSPNIKQVCPHRSSMLLLLTQKQC